MGTLVPPLLLKVRLAKVLLPLRFKAPPPLIVTSFVDSICP